MARIVLGSYMVRYPMGGMLSWVLQWIVGFQQLGHEIYFVEKSGYPDSCFDPIRGVMSDDCSYGTKVLRELLSRFDLDERWCFVDQAGVYHGLSRPRIEEIIGSADVFVDMGTHGSWLAEAQRAQTRVLVDGEPAFTQMKMANTLADDGDLVEYDFYYTVGQNIDTRASTAPSAGRHWKHVYHPVVPDLFEGALRAPSPTNEVPAAATTVMNWQSYEPVSYEGQEYGHKDREFVRFMDLPKLTSVPLEVAVSGRDVPVESLRKIGWRVRDAHEVTISFDSFRDYIAGSLAEFSVCKNGYVATNSGWFSDRSAAYLASGRPVVMQETGFSSHLPSGLGLIAVRDAEEAAAALTEVAGNYERHAAAALEIARDYLDARRVLARMLDEIRG